MASKNNNTEVCSGCGNYITDTPYWAKDGRVFCDSCVRKLFKNDNVDHPAHYSTGNFECIDVMLEVFGEEAVKDFCILNAFKYLYRAGRKNGIEDIEKAKWYIDKYLSLSPLS